MEVVFVGMSPGLLKCTTVHKHSNWELLWYIEGKGTLYLGGREYEFSPGTIVCQPPNVMHYERSDVGFRNIFIQVKDFILPTKVPVPIFKDNIEQSFGVLMKMAYSVYHKKEANWETLVNALFEAMYQFLISWAHGKMCNSAVELVRYEIIQNISNPDFDIAKAVRETGYCGDYFRRSFYKEIGDTPKSYLINLRINYATKMLKQRSITGLTLKEIAEMSGFSDFYYFSKLYKKKTGICPSKIR